MSENQELMELIWRDGQLVTRGFSTSREKKPSKIVATSDSGIDHDVLQVFHNNKKHEEEESWWVQEEQLEKYRSHFHNAFSEQNGRGGGNMISSTYDIVPKDSPQVVPVVHQTYCNSRRHRDSLPPPLKRLSLKKETQIISKSSRESPPLNFALFFRSPAPPVPANITTTTTTTSNENLQKKPAPAPAAANNNNDDNNNNKKKNKGKVDGGKSKEAEATVPSASASLCSLEASNNITTLKRSCYDGYEGEGSAYCPSYQNEKKRRKKAVISRSSNGGSGFLSDGKTQTPAKRRDRRINKKMRALQELIPNCSKVDKALMLDEAIDYLKTLQFQVQMMSMGTGICMPPMMLPSGMQQHIMNAATAPLMIHFPPMGMRLGLGMPMDVGCNPAAQFQGPTHHTTTVPGIQMPGFLGQPQLSISMLRPPFMGLMPHNSLPVSSFSQPTVSMNFMDSAPLTNSKQDSIQNV